MTFKNYFKYCSIVLMALFFHSCFDTAGTVSNVTTPLVTPPVPLPSFGSTVTSNMCTTPTTKILDYGERSVAATAGVRGAFSDTAINPANNYPAFIYNDASIVGLKFLYWDGSKYNLEIVSAGLTYNFVKLVYLSDGRPLIFWANGATAIYMASRASASVASSTWTVTVIENIATMTTRAVEATVSPDDKVGVFYINAAGTSSRVILCSANCETASNYAGMGVVGNFISNTASNSSNSADIKFCNAGSGVYYPYVAYPGTVNSIIARCTQSTLSSCLTPANWSNTAITDGTNATGANQFVAKLDINTASSQPFNVVARRATGNELRAYTQNTGNCATGALTFNATSRSIATAATLANAYGSLARDANNKFHLVVNEGTANVRYFNSSGTITTVWNAVASVETTTIAAAGLTRGGLAVDTNSDQILLTYGRTAAGTPVQTLGNVVLAFSHCPTGATGCASTTLASPSSATGLVFGNIPLDVTGQVQLLTAQLPNTISVATTSIGRPAIAYIDFSVGSATTGRLKYKYRTGNLSTDSWTMIDIGTANSPHSVSLAFDHNDQPWIAYYDANTLRYFLLTNSQSDGSGLWTQYQFPVATAAAATLPAVNNVALAMSYSAGVATPVMFVSNSGAATRFVRTAQFNSTTETWSNNTLLDTGTNQFSKLSADYNTSGKIVLAYHDTTNTSVRYTQSINGGATWTAAAQIISGTMGMGLRVKLNPVSGQPALAFYERATNLVRYKSCTSAFASCTSSANWVNLGNGIVESSAGVSGLTAAATDGLLNASLSFTVEGYPEVIYNNGAGGNGHLYYSATSAASPLFGTASILSASTNAVETTPVAATPANFGLGGWNATSVRSMATGSLFTAYIGPGNYLYMKSCGN
ncbi:MAG: hypothetical protein V4654_05720 [Bdellovibrionota bacterium]